MLRPSLACNPTCSKDQNCQNRILPVVQYGKPLVLYIVMLLSYATDKMLQMFLALHIYVFVKRRRADVRLTSTKGIGVDTHPVLHNQIAAHAAASVVCEARRLRSKHLAYLRDGAIRKEVVVWHCCVGRLGIHDVVAVFAILTP